MENLWLLCDVAEFSAERMVYSTNYIYILCKFDIIPLLFVTTKFSLYYDII